MNIDKINDIEVLRNKLKKYMAQCKESFKKDNCKFNKDEYYEICEVMDYIYLYDDNEKEVKLNYDEANKYLKER